MSLSDSTDGSDSQWRPLHPKHISEPEREPVRDDAFDEFKLLYEPPDTPDANAFSFLYRVSHSPPATVQEEDHPEKQCEEKEPEPDVEKIRKQAYEEGFASGEKKGFAEGKHKLDSALDRIQTLLSEMETIWEHLIETHERQILQLISRVAEKVVFGRVDIDRNVIKRTILHAFQMVPEPVKVTIELNAEDAEYIETIKEDFFLQVKTLKNVTVIPNPLITRGGCKVKTRFGEVDATLESRLEAIRQAIVNVSGNKVKDGSHTASEL